MSINKADARVQVHRFTNSGEQPTIPITEDFTSSSFTASNILKGEFSVHLNDDKAWYRTNNSIVPIHSGSLINFPESLTFSNGLVGTLVNISNFGLKLRTSSKLLDITNAQNFIQLDDSYGNLTLYAPIGNANISISAPNGKVSLNSFTCSVSNDMKFEGMQAKIFAQYSTNQIDFDYSGSGRFLISNDNGVMNGSYIYLYGNIVLNTNGTTNINANNGVVITGTNSSITVGSNLNNNVETYIHTGTFYVNGNTGTHLTLGLGTGTTSMVRFNQNLPTTPVTSGQLYRGTIGTYSNVLMISP